MKMYFSFRLALVAASLLFGAAQVHAQATRTWVSGVGDDVNPCSRTAPCKTFAGAISKTAAGGEINVLDAGSYGRVTIRKSITIASDVAFGGITVAGTTGVFVDAPVGTVVVVTLRDLAINSEGSGAVGLNGISFTTAGRLVVENVRINGFALNGILFEPSAASTLVVTASAINNHAGAGIYVKPGSAATATAVLDGVTLIANGRGLRAEDGSSVEVRNSHATLSTNSGFVAAGTSRPVSMFVERSAATFNNLGGVHAGMMATVRISNFMATGNGTGLSTSGGAIMSFVNNPVSGNTTDGTPSLTASEK
jgi:hypothetical protein